MVVSKLDKSISYPERKHIEIDDKNDGEEINMYQINAKDVDIIIAVGKANSMFEEYNITYFPIYLIKKDGKAMQIGVYELKSSDLMEYTDDEGSLEVDRLNNPLLYVFVNTNLLEGNRMIPELSDSEKENDSSTEKEPDENKPEEKESDEKESEEKDSEEKESEEDDDNENQSNIIPKVRQDIFVATKGSQLPEELEQETKKQAQDYRKKYQEKDTHKWVNKFMKNKHYYLVDNEGGGDCFFATVRDAFSQIGQQTTVEKLRKKIANEVTPELFENNKLLYDSFNDQIVTDKQIVLEMEQEYNKYKQLFFEAKDREQKKQYASLAKEISIKWEQTKMDLMVTKKWIEDVAFMKKVNNVEQFKKIVQTCEFWAEAWALSTMERVLNIKFILLSSDAYSDKDMGNVLQCGQMIDDLLESRGVFQPEYYILLDYLGYHYKLIGYKKKQIFKFHELPYDIKQMVNDKCMERNSGAFSLIPDFIEFNKAEGKGDVNGNLGLKKGTNIEDLSDAKIRGLYDDNILFQYYSKSSDKPVPGKGSGEKMPVESKGLFSTLNAIPQWRRKLDNSWVLLEKDKTKPFELDNHLWRSVDHYYQANKFKEGSPQFYRLFAAESGSKMSTDVAMAKAAGSKTGTYKGEQIRPDDVRVDPDFYGKRREKVTKDAIEAKFSQIVEMKRVLLETKNAKLMLFRQGMEPEVQNDLMVLREQMREI